MPLLAGASPRMPTSDCSPADRATTSNRCQGPRCVSTTGKPPGQLPWTGIQRRETEASFNAIRSSDLRKVTIPPPTDAVARTAQADGERDQQSRPLSRTGPEPVRRRGCIERCTKLVLDGDAAGCTNEVRVSHLTSGCVLGAGAGWRDDALFSETGIGSLVRPRGWRRLRRFAGRTGGSGVACRGLTPDPATAIQAVTGSGVDAGQDGETRSIKNQILLIS